MRYIQPLSHIRRDDRLEPRRRPLWRRAVSAPAGFLAVCVAVTGCGGGPSTPHVASGATTTATTVASPSDRSTSHATGLLTYASCMRSHGVPNFPDPSGDGGIPKQAVISSMQQVSSSQAERGPERVQERSPSRGLA